MRVSVSCVLASLAIAEAVAATTTHQPPSVTRPRETIDDAAAIYPPGYSSQWLDDRRFVYGPALLGFDLQAYLSETAPHLLAEAEFMSHWCGYYSISPKVLLAILEVRRSAVTNRAVRLDARGEIHDLLRQLYDDFYAFRAQRSALPDGLNGATYALLNAFRSGLPLEAFAPDVDTTRRRFLDAYAELFPDPDASAPVFPLRSDAVPPADLLQLPWKAGQSWFFNGVHTTTGSDPGVMSSIDFTRTWSLTWGANTSTDYVVAAHAGTVTRYSGCFVGVTAPSGWATTYYHLDNVAVATGQQVSANQTLGTYAGTQSQALCQGGHSTGPHVHFSLLKDGFYSPLDGAGLSQFVVRSGRYSYDYDPAYMWLQKNGTRYYAYGAAIESSTPVLPVVTINDVWVFEGNSGTRVARFIISLSAPSSTTVSLSYATANGTATANGDYTARSGSLAITPSSTSQILDVTVNGDTSVEATETFVLNLSNPSGVTLGDSQGVARILNDDFTDPSLPGAFVKSAHLTELRALINDLRARRGLGSFAFTGTLTPGITIVGAAHVLELRTALNAVYSAAGQGPPVYTNSLTAGATPIRAIDVSEIRTHALNAP